MNDAQENGRLELVFAALADPTRRAIYRRLSFGPLRVTALAEPFEISLNSVSKHIQILENAGLIVRKRSGREHLLSLNPYGLKPMTNWLERTRDEWDNRLIALEHVVTKKAKDQQQKTGKGTAARTGTFPVGQVKMSPIRAAAPNSQRSLELPRLSGRACQSCSSSSTATVSWRTGRSMRPWA